MFVTLRIILAESIIEVTFYSVSDFNVTQLREYISVADTGYVISFFGNILYF